MSSESSFNSFFFGLFSFQIIFSVSYLYFTFMCDLIIFDACGMNANENTIYEKIVAWCNNIALLLMPLSLSVLISA